MFKASKLWRWAGRLSGPWMGVLLLAGLVGCRHHGAYVYAGVDPDAALVRTDAIFFKSPVDPTIRERRLAVTLREELERNGFNLVEDLQKARLILSFGVDRHTYAAGTVSQGFVFGPGFTGRTKVVNATDVTVSLFAYQAQDEGKTPIKVLWEGSVRATDKVFKVLPNAMIRNLVVRFGQNYDRLTRVDKDYQRGIRRQRAGMEPVAVD